MTELNERLIALMVVIRGGPWPWLSQGIHAYDGKDEQCQKIYDGCCELEELGMVTRKRLGDGHYFFEPSA